MPEMVLTFQDTDLIVPREELLRLGLRPGDSLILRPMRSPAEDQELEKILDELRGSWSQEDEDAFYQNREKMWATWKPRSW
ncbi:MAG: hypothetical protein JXA33_28200 [Anaerolineae bacterium]|nr:hypothetical protein [Anaerolineae bacterium]